MKSKKKNRFSESLYDDTFSYLSFTPTNDELSLREDEKIDDLLEEYHIEDLDLSDLDKDAFDESLNV